MLTLGYFLLYWEVFSGSRKHLWEPSWGFPCSAFLPGGPEGSSLMTLPLTTPHACWWKKIRIAASTFEQNACVSGKGSRGMTFGLHSLLKYHAFSRTTIRSPPTRNVSDFKVIEELFQYWNLGVNLIWILWIFFFKELAKFETKGILIISMPPVEVFDTYSQLGKERHYQVHLYITETRV